VYKLVGPVLLKQDLIEAVQTVEKRISYIQGEMYKRKYFILNFIVNKFKFKIVNVTKLQLKTQRLSKTQLKKI
jgi:prefoldin beta subunit